jgi:hypothetical protein
MPRLQCNLKDAISGKALGDRTKQLGVARGLLTAVAALHENGMVHRDIKVGCPRSPHCDGCCCPCHPPPPLPPSHVIKPGRVGRATTSC